jgi:hypothetical protein
MVENEVPYDYNPKIQCRKKIDKICSLEYEMIHSSPVPRFKKEKMCEDKIGHMIEG